jgi:hypothetical protein
MFIAVDSYYIVLCQQLDIWVFEVFIAASVKSGQ